MTLPAEYSWLEKLKGLPNNIKVALSLYGTAEIIGKGSNATILSWRDELNQAGVKVTGYSDDDIPWCGLFVAYCTLKRVNKAEEVVKEPLWARNWAKYGIKANEAALGDVLVFVRNGGGHVGFYVAEDKSTFHVLGGNQSNKVCITRIAKDRCIAVRRPAYQVAPASVKPYFLASNGAVSTNEA